MQARRVHNLLPPSDPIRRMITRRIYFFGKQATVYLVINISNKHWVAGEIVLPHVDAEGEMVASFGLMDSAVTWSATSVSLRVLLARFLRSLTVAYRL